MDDQCCNDTNEWHLLSCQKIMGINQQHGPPTCFRKVYCRTPTFGSISPRRRLMLLERFSGLASIVGSQPGQISIRTFLESARRVCSERPHAFFSDVHWSTSEAPVNSRAIQDHSSLPLVRPQFMTQHEVPEGFVDFLHMHRGHGRYPHTRLGCWSISDDIVYARQNTSL